MCSGGGGDSFLQSDHSTCMDDVFSGLVFFWEITNHIKELIIELVCIHISIGCANRST